MNQYVINAASDLTLRGLIKLASPAAAGKANPGEAYQRSLEMGPDAKSQIGLTNRALADEYKENIGDISSIKNDYRRQMADLERRRKAEIADRQSIYNQNAAFYRNNREAEKYKKNVLAPSMQRLTQMRALSSNPGLITREMLQQATPKNNLADLGRAFF